MPFFQGASDIQVNNSTFNDIARDQINNNLIQPSQVSPSASFPPRPKFKRPASTPQGRGTHSKGATAEDDTEVISETSHEDGDRDKIPVPGVQHSSPVPPAISRPVSAPAAPASVPAPALTTAPTTAPATAGTAPTPQRPASFSAVSLPVQLQSSTVPLQPQEPRGADIIDTALGVSSFVLTALQDASQFAPVPFLGDAATLALGILNLAQASRDSKVSFLSLASDACALVYSVVVIYKEQEQEGKQMPSDLNNNLSELVNTLSVIQEFANKQAKRRFLKRMVHSQRDIAKIQDYRTRLRQSLDIFWLQSSIHVRENLTRIAEQQGVMYEVLQNSRTSGALSESDEPTHEQDKLAVLSRIDCSHSDFSHSMFNQVGGNVFNVTNNR